MIYIITVTLIRMSNSFIRQYNLDDEAYIGCIELFYNTGENVQPTDEN